MKVNEKHMAILAYIKKYSKENGYSPTYREIMKHAGMKSTSTVAYYIQALKDYGFIAMQEKKPRTIQVLKEGVA